MTNSATLGSFGDASNAPLVFRNKIINGAMAIDQRNAGAAINNTTSSSFPLDRFIIDGSVATKFSGQQSSVCPTGFTKSLSLTSSAATTVGSSDYYRVMHHIEGQNVADLSWGTSSAKSVTLSFWAYCSLTGTFSGAIRNSAANRSYPFTYSINAINTWEYKTINISGDTTGTWLTDTGIGLTVIFSLGCGSTRIGTAGTWSASNYMGATGETQLVATNGANLRFSGIQLEAGLSATPFEQRPIGMELSLCQRYCYVQAPLSTAAYRRFGIGFAHSTTTCNATIQLPVTMRIAPTPTFSSVGLFAMFDGVNLYGCTALSYDSAGTTSDYITIIQTTSGLTQFRPHSFVSNNNTTAQIVYSAEL